MYGLTEKMMPLEVQKKRTYFSINSSKAPITTQNRTSFPIIYEIKTYKNNSKNNRPINKRSSDSFMNRIIAEKYGRNKTSLDKTIYNGLNRYGLQTTKRTHKSNNKKNEIKNYFTNVYDINNNNYFVNLYETSTSIPSKYKYRNSVLNKNFNSQVISRNEDKNDNISISYHTNKPNKTTFYDNSISNIFTDLNTSFTIEMMKNYRNKLLKEFMKYIRKFYRYHYKKYFIYFINQLKTIKKRKPKSEYIYSKKFQKIPYTKLFKKVAVKPFINKKKIINKNSVIINRNKLYREHVSCLTDRKIDGGSIVSKIINNQSNELSDGKIRNIFLDSSFLNEKLKEEDNSYNHNNSSSIDNISYRRRRINISNRILSPNPTRKYNTINTNSREIKINFRIINKLRQEKNEKIVNNSKIQFRYNYFVFDENKNNKKKSNDKKESYVISNLVNSFSIIISKHKFEGRKKFINIKKDSKFLSAIKEEDEKYSLSLQDSIPGDNIVHLKESTSNSQITKDINKDIMKLKSLINKFINEKYQKILLNKIKGIIFAYKINQVLKNKEKEKEKDKDKDKDKIKKNN